MQKTINSVAPVYRERFGFTLVELIVVITVLSILGTIAFASFQWHVSGARDSNRISDVVSIKKILQMGYVKTGSYPIPSDPLKTVVHSGSTVFYEGTFGESVARQLQAMSKHPNDPLYGVHYTYSVTNKRNQYQIGYITENPVASFHIVDTAFASSIVSQVEGNYSASIAVSNDNYVSPSIITSLTNTGIIDTANLSGKFVTDGWGTIPFSYSKDSPIILLSSITVTFGESEWAIVNCADCIVYP